MTNFVLAVIAALLWGGAYGAYFGPDIRRWWRRRRARRAVRPFAPVIQRPRPNRPRPVVRPILVARPTPPIAAAPPASNVIPFPRRPRLR